MAVTDCKSNLEDDNVGDEHVLSNQGGGGGGGGGLLNEFLSKNMV